MKITNTNVYGIENAVLVSRYPMIADVEAWRGKTTTEEMKLWLENGLVEIFKILKENKDKYRLEKDEILTEVDGVQIKFSPQDLIKFHNKKWSYNKTRGYIRDSKGKIELHRLIADNPNNYDVDHIDRNKNNYTRTNLRLATHRENSINKNVISSNTSGIMGVYWRDDRKKWVARIQDNKKTYNLGHFNDKESAIIARLNAEKELFKEFAPQRYLFEKYGIEKTEIEHLPKFPDITEYIQAYKNSLNLAHSRGSEGHDQALTGITVTFDVTGSIQWWQEAERYRFLYFISSTSKMHRLHKMNIDECCNKYVDPKIKEIVECKQQEYLHALELQKEGILPANEVRDYFYRLVYNVPSGFEYTAGMVTNYRQLKTIYQQRKNHRLQEWKDFCRWIKELPCSEFIIGEE